MKAFKSLLVSRFRRDLHFRLRVTLVVSLVSSALLAIFSAVLGLIWHSAWYGSLAAYYIILAVMRLWLLGNVRGGAKRTGFLRELVLFRRTGVALLLINVALFGVFLYVVAFGYGSEYGEITTIAYATYTFVALTVAIVNISKYKKFGRPAMSAVKLIDLTCAVVSVIALEAAMISAFGGSGGEFRTVVTALTGAGIFTFVLLLALFMIISSNKKIKFLREKQNDKQ